MEFFDRHGIATCYSPDGETIYLWSGEPVGYFHNDQIYSFRGRLLGWHENGWLYDRVNRPALFSQDATGGPVKPVRQVKPAKGVRKVKPVKGVRQVAHVRRVRSTSWSEYSGAGYFNQ
ncbi:MAG: hypothetical protein JWN21_653 [Sphingomonas bacterium]|uniref:4-fold beta flower protein n=1 Tax=Sphingomonas bacterium TaxID=1895847 RepID=UPI00262B2347|nr:hypothetical protein [Sphingomonas bacterium]MDB5695110.1 hypothetical protein [Sphingomonas bacterium]